MSRDLMKQARLNREQAQRARRLAGTIDTHDVIERLLRYADDLERQAVESEWRAFVLAETAAKTRYLAAGIQ